MNPEPLNLWDRIFNRYKKEILGRGTETWHTTRMGQAIPYSSFYRDYVEYKIIDRLTGGETIEREYLN